MGDVPFSRYLYSDGVGVGVWVHTADVLWSDSLQRGGENQPAPHVFSTLYFFTWRVVLNFTSSAAGFYENYF